MNPAKHALINKLVVVVFGGIFTPAGSLPVSAHLSLLHRLMQSTRARTLRRMDCRVLPADKQVFSLKM